MEGEGFEETKGKHGGVIFLLARIQIYREGVTDYTAQSRVTLHTDGLLSDVSFCYYQIKKNPFLSLFFGLLTNAFVQFIHHINKLELCFYSIITE